MRTKNYKKWVFVLSSISLFCAQVYAEETPSPENLLKKSLQAIHTQNEQSLYVMKLIGSGGDVSTREMRVWFKSVSDDDAKLMIKFTKPADIRGTGILMISEKGKAQDQWLYLPALKKSRRIKGGNPDEPFLGSDFSMGDLSGAKDGNLQYRTEGIKKCDEFDCYVVVGESKDASADSTYSKKVYWIRKDNYLGVKAEFYNQSNQLEKVLTLSKAKKDGNRWVVDSIEMKNLLTKHSTVMEFVKRDTKSVPADSIFTVNFLERQ